MWVVRINNPANLAKNRGIYAVIACVSLKFDVIIRKITPAGHQWLMRPVSLTSKRHKPFLQSREQGDLIVVFVINYPINSYDNPTKNHCSERDPPRPRSEHKFYGIFLLINLHTAIYTHRKLSRGVPVFAQIGAAGSQANQDDSSKPNATRYNQRQFCG